jgi:hypothetical protein
MGRAHLIASVAYCRSGDGKFRLTMKPKENSLISQLTRVMLRLLDAVECGYPILFVSVLNWSEPNALSNQRWGMGIPRGLAAPWHKRQMKILCKTAIASGKKPNQHTPKCKGTFKYTLSIDVSE